MARVLDPFRFVVIAVAGWMNQRQLLVIEYLREENRVLREQLGGRCVRLNDDQRRRLAEKAKGLGRKLLADIATIVTPETLLAWHRQLIAQKYDGSASADRGARAQSERLKLWSFEWQKRTSIGDTVGYRAHSPTWTTNLPAARSPTSFNVTAFSRHRNGAVRRPGRSL